MSDILSSMNWSPILGLLVTLVTGLLTWLANSIKNHNAAATEASKAQTAALKLAAIGTALLQKAWGSLSPVLQQSLADGKLTGEERAALEVQVQALLKEVTDEDTLKEIGEALGLPLAGIIAKLASYLIGVWTEAHDTAVPTSSAKTFPIGSQNAQLDPNDPIYKPG